MRRVDGLVAEAAARAHDAERRAELRLQRLQSLGLVKARKGRAGSTLSRAGENFLANMAARR